jgi:DNA-binding LytR/AlgR family response regulator
MRCIIIDDEPLAIEVLERYVQQTPQLQLVTTFQNPVEAFHYLQKEVIDLIFVDIEMPVLTGMDLLKTLKQAPKAIITTAYRDFAVESYELNVIDYLVKPIPFHRFIKAVQKAFLAEGSTPMHSADTNTTLNEIWVKADKKLHRITLEDIYYIESLKDYIRIKTKQEEVITYQTMQAILQKLPSDQFVRIHKSFIVALSYITAIEGNQVFVGKAALPIGRLYKEQFLSIIVGKQGKLSK